MVNLRTNEMSKDVIITIVTCYIKFRENSLKIYSHIAPQNF